MVACVPCVFVCVCVDLPLVVLLCPLPISHRARRERAVAEAVAAPGVFGDMEVEAGDPLYLHDATVVGASVTVLRMPAELFDKLVLSPVRLLGFAVALLGGIGTVVWWWRCRCVVALPWSLLPGCGALRPVCLFDADVLARWCACVCVCVWGWVGVWVGGCCALALDSSRPLCMTLPSTRPW